MKIYGIALAPRGQKEKSVFDFQRAASSRDILKKGSNELYDGLLRALGDENETAKDAWVEFELKGRRYVLSATTNAEGVTRRALKEKDCDGKTEVVAREKRVNEELYRLAGCDLRELAQNCFASADGFKEFVKTGSARSFADLDGLLRTADEGEKVFAGLKERHGQALERARRMTDADIPFSAKENIEKLFAAVKANLAEREERASELEKLKRNMFGQKAAGALAAEYASDSAKLEKLLENKDYIDLKRGQLAAYDEACELVARMRRLDAEKQVLEALKEKRQALKGEIDWQDGEFASITEQLVSKQAQADSLIAKKSRMEIAIDEQKKAEELKRRNNELTESMGKLNVQLDRLETKKVNLKNNLADVEQSIAEIRQSMESFNIPEQSIGELMENVRAEVKITEIRAQTDRLQTEIAARESDIADKELTISGQTKQLNSLMALDSTVAPLKAKDAIVSVIDAKIDKLTLINDSLKEKLNNFRRALEDNGFQEMRLEQSSESISTVLVRKQFAKEEEFKRQVLLAGREEPDNISVMSALPAQLDDPEIERLKSDLANRTMDRQEAMRASAMLKGAMGEISRHIAVNNAEIESLRQEKSNINRKYLELVAQNQAESTQQYLKSLETNGATRYLLGIQEDVVKNETELRALKRDLEQKKGRLTELTTRLNYLSDNRRSVSDEGGLEVIMQTNEQIKHELADIGDRLSLSYKQHKTILDTIDQLDNKRLRIQELIIETLQKIRANEREIVAAGEKAEEFAGGETEERLAELEGELEEVESERNMLFDSKENLSRQVFDKRVELRCLEIDCDVKEKALEESRRSLSEMLKSSERNEEWIRAIADLSDEDIEATRRGVKNFDYLFEKLTERTDTEKRALELLPREKEIPRAAERAAHLERRLANLDAKAAELEEKLDYELNVFVNTGALKVSLAQAANEAEILGGLTEALNETKVASAIIYDKVKSVVAYADSLLKTMSEGRLGVSFENELVFSDSEQNAIELAGIENTDRLLIYLSLLLAQPAHNGERGNWLIVDERIVCNRLKLNKALSLLDVEYAAV